MAKICKSCGNYYKGDYCDKCGYGKPAKSSKAAKKYKKPTKPDKFRSEEDKAVYAKWANEDKKEELTRRKDPKANLKFLILVAVVVVGVVIAVLYSSGIIFASNKTDVVDKYFKAIEDNDFDSFVSCFPSEIKDNYEKERDDLGYSGEECMKVFAGAFNESCGDDFKLKVEYGKETELSKDDYDMTQYKEEYGSVPNISQMYELVVYVTATGSKGSEDAKLYINVGRCFGGWKIFDLTEDNGIIDESMEIVDSAA